MADPNYILFNTFFKEWRMYDGFSSTKIANFTHSGSFRAACTVIAGDQGDLYSGRLAPTLNMYHHSDFTNSLLEIVNITGPFGTNVWGMTFDQNLDLIVIFDESGDLKFNKYDGFSNVLIDQLDPFETDIRGLSSARGSQDLTYCIRDQAQDVMRRTNGFGTGLKQTFDTAVSPAGGGGWENDSGAMAYSITSGTANQYLHDPFAVQVDVFNSGRQAADNTWWNRWDPLLLSSRQRRIPSLIRHRRPRKC